MQPDSPGLAFYLPSRESYKHLCACRYATFASTLASGGIGALSGALHSLNASTLLVTFGSASIAPFVANWVHQLRTAGHVALLVGALDAATFDAGTRGGIPTIHAGANGSESGPLGSGYFRKDYDRFKRMGSLKLAFLATLLEALAAGGLDGVWVCDADMVWLRPPTAAALFAESSLRGADVHLTSDCLDLEADRRGGCASKSNFNTGVMYVRASDAGVRFVTRWLEKMRHAGPEPWLDDQAILNDMLRPGLKPLAADDTPSIGSSLRQSASQRGRIWTYRTDGGRLTIGMLPLELFSNGHTFFVQHPCAFCRGPRCGCTAPLPFAVHATFQYGDGDEFAFGKRLRLQQAGLWGDATHASALLTSPLETLSRHSSLPTARQRQLPPSAPTASHERWSRPAAAARERLIVLATTHRVVETQHDRQHGPPAEAHNDSRRLVSLQRRIDWAWRRRVLALLALGIALNRTVVLPPCACHCDLYWGEMKACLGRL